MKTALKTIGWMMTWGASAAYAAQGSNPETIGWIGYAFIGFFAVVIATQLVPAAVLFAGMLRGLYTTASKNAGAHE